MIDVMVKIPKHLKCLHYAPEQYVYFTRIIQRNNIKHLNQLYFLDDMMHDTLTITHTKKSLEISPSFSYFFSILLIL